MRRHSKRLARGTALVVLAVWLGLSSVPAHCDLTSPDGKGQLTVLDAGHNKYKVHLEGTAYEMGYQHGYLLAEKVRDTCATSFARGLLLNMLGGEPDIAAIVENEETFAVVMGVVETAALSQSVYATLPMQMEMHGIVAGAKARLQELGEPEDDIRYGRVVVANLGFDVLLSYAYPFIVNSYLSKTDAPAIQKTIVEKMHACDGFVALGSATETGETIMGRNFMLSPIVTKDSVIMEYDPLIGNRFVACNTPGFVGVTVAMNSHGVCIGMDMVPSLYTNPVASGMGTLLTARYVMQYKNNVPDAVRAIKNSVARGCPWIYLVGGPGSGAVAEAGPTYGLGWWQNQSKYFAARYTDYQFDGSQHPQYPEVDQDETRSDIVTTSNHFVDPGVTTACGAWANPDSIGRYDYLTGIVQAAITDGDKITVEEAKELTNYLSPFSSYTHWHYGEDTLVEGVRAVFDVENMEMHVLWGYSWSDPWMTYTW